MGYSFQRYENYKKVDNLAFDELPVEWTLKKVKHLFTIGRGRVISQEELDDNGVFPVYSSQTQNNGCLGFINTYDFDCKQITWTTDGANAGTVFLREGKHNCTNVCGTLQPISKNLNFSFYLYSLQYVTQFHKRPDTNGAKIMNGEMAAISLCIPSDYEQQKIANFLDYETAKIDILITKQEKLIKLLKEKRQAVISHAVTKGLNPDAPMKDSGVEWLGEVPEHWDLKRFKHLFKIRKRIAGQTGYDILSITQKGIKVKDITSGEGQLSMDYSKYQLVYQGDYAMNHMDLLTGFVDISSHNGVTSPDYRVFTLEHKLSEPSYYLRLLQMGYLDKLFYPLGQGAAHIGRWRLPTEAFNEFIAPCPPSEEQKEISDYIDKNHRKIDSLLEKAQGAIILMKERKAALISAAVTGKIDVRDWQEPTKQQG
ncbi:type I restriction enzyme, S subunit [Vibrio crassostreae]|nr:type I restriction enzyme, S subunit [Vibrio crassostreae]